jgi:hypothetical protein
MFIPSPDGNIPAYCVFIQNCNNTDETTNQNTIFSNSGVTTQVKPMNITNNGSTDFPTCSSTTTCPDLNPSVSNLTCSTNGHILPRTYVCPNNLQTVICNEVKDGSGYASMTDCNSRCCNGNNLEFSKGQCYYNNWVYHYEADQITSQNFEDSQDGSSECGEDPSFWRWQVAQIPNGVNYCQDSSTAYSHGGQSWAYCNTEGGCSYSGGWCDNGAYCQVP